MYWERGSERRIYFGARHWLYALDAPRASPSRDSATDGRIDLREGFEGRDPRGSASASTRRASSTAIC